MDPREFYHQAEGLILMRPGQPAPLPVAVRTAVSRAYYAAYHLARELLSTWGFEVRAHEVLIQHLNAAGDQTLGEIAAMLATLREARLRADYDLRDERAENLRVATTHVMQTRVLLGRLEGYTRQGSPTQAVEVIREWRRTTGRDQARR